jgi:hypothetical protein
MPDGYTYITIQIQVGEAAFKQKAVENPSVMIQIKA